jgi:hypothetical protein
MGVQVPPPLKIWTGMHSKLKGNIASTTTVLELQKRGFNVFSEIGDYSRIDLIAEKNSILRKIQVKYANSSREDGVAILRLEKSGPNGYRYTYDENDIDWFAVYSPITEKVYWVRSKIACKNNSMFKIRFLPPQNNQTSGVNLAENFGIEKLEEDFIVNNN